jgi:hypothetical protein
MKSLDFNPSKTGKEFRKNYELHDLAEYHGKNLLFQWGVNFNDYGKDRRFERVWEKGEDKPDIIAEYNEVKFLIDWKGKTKRAFWVNRRAIDSYKNWSSKLNLDVVICFFVFDTKNKLADRRFAILSIHQFIEDNKKAWDQNRVIKFDIDLPKFTKSNLINQIFHK